MLEKITKFLKDLPYIFLVFICFVILFTGYLITGNERVFDLANTALGGVIGLASRQLLKNEPLPVPPGGADAGAFSADFSIQANNPPGDKTAAELKPGAGNNET